MMSTRETLSGLAGAFFLVASAILAPVVQADDDESETDVSWGDLPKAVQDALKEAWPDMEFESLTREDEDGFVTYEAETGDTEVELSEAGDVIETESAVDAAALPAAIVAQMEQRYPGATIVDAALVRRTHYELELTSGSGETEISLYADGSVFDGAVGGTRRFGGFDEVLDFDELPATIQDALAEWSLVAEFDSVERDEKDGIVSYKARYQGNSGNTQIKLAETGDLIEIRSVVDAESLPSAIVKQIEARFSDASLEDATEFRHTYYVVGLKTASDEKEVGYFADGSVAEEG